MKLISLLLVTIISYASARPTFGKIAEVLLNVLTDDQHQYPSSQHGGYQQGYNQQYHYGGDAASGYSHVDPVGGYPNNGYYQQLERNPYPINPAYGYNAQHQSGSYPNGNYAPNGYYGQSLQPPPYNQQGYTNYGY